MRPTHLLSVGDEAPDFCLTATQLVNGKQRKRQLCLHDFRGKQAVIITFYGAAFTPV
ncbi:MAG: redoxin domain-containing protein [Chloroflexota bacterium]